MHASCCVGQPQGKLLLVWRNVEIVAWCPPCGECSGAPVRNTGWRATRRRRECEESEEQTRAYRKKDERRGSGSGPWSAGRPRRDGGASADFRADSRVRVGGNFCFEGGYDYRGGRDGASSGGGRR
jgi:hypothetical protein